MLAAIARLGLGEWMNSLPAGLQTEVGQRGSGLSAGERQLVALIRAEMSDPDVLILDEATSSVDPQTESRIARALDVLSRGRTTISVAHRLSTASRADRVIVMADGKVVGSGRHGDLLELSPDYANLYAAWLSSATVE
jgi:putative ABC transport system ATP-binding protein